MNTLLNHTDLATNIRDNNLENAKSLYIKKIRTLLHLTHNTNELKKLLYSINIFVYTYFCINSSLSLENLCSVNHNLIDKFLSSRDLMTLGEKIIKSYLEFIHNDNLISNNEIIKNALTYIHANIENKISLDKVAVHVHISSNYLCYLFKENTGYKFCEYINIYRINTAKDFLDNSSSPIDIVSFKCGFNSQSHFSTTFKKYVGTSPNEFRKRTR